MKIYYNAKQRVYFGKYKSAEGKWRNKLCPVSVAHDEALALAWFTAWLRNHDDVWRPEEHTKKSVRELASKWLSWKREKSEDDYASAERLLRLYVYPTELADVDLETELSVGHATAWTEWLLTKKVGYYAKRNATQAVRSMLSDMRGKGWANIRENPFTDPFVRKLLKGPRSRTIVHVPVPSLVSLLSATERPDRVLRVLFAACTGLRLREAAALAWSHIDLTGPVPHVRVERQLSKLEDGEATFKLPKRDSTRVIPLHPALVTALSWWKTMGWSQHTGLDNDPSRPVFPNPGGGFGVGRWSAHLREMLADAGCPVKCEGKAITWHSLRRSFLTMLTDAGVPHVDVQHLAGHAPDGVTAKHYVAKNLPRFAGYVAMLPIPSAVPACSHVRLVISEAS
jgi:integrase